MLLRVMVHSSMAFKLLVFEKELWYRLGMGERTLDKQKESQPYSRFLTIHKICGLINKEDLFEHNGQCILTCTGIWNFRDCTNFPAYSDQLST